MPPMKRGPKGQVDESPLPWRPRGVPSQRLRSFAKKFLVVPKGRNVGKRMILQPWQIDMMAKILDPDPRPSIVGIMCGRGQGKTQLMACWSLYEAFTGPDGNQIVVVASSERQAHLLFDSVTAMVGLNEELSSRCAVYRDRIEIPGKGGASLAVMPAESKLLEGLGNFSLAIADEIGVIPRETWETLLLGLGKVDNATVVGIGTPSVSNESVLLDLRNYARQEGANDPTFEWIEFSADEFAGIHPLDCRHCWLLANPAMNPELGEPFLAESALTALLPPKTTPGGFARARLCQFVSENTDPFIPPDVWDSLNTGQPIPDGAEVVVGVDGAFGGRDSDAAALVIGTVSATPHFDVLAIYENPGDPNWRVPILKVESDIRDACKRFNVREVTMDPFRLNQTMQTLASDGIPVSEWPWSPSRTTRATTDLYQAAVNGKITHSGHEVLTRHVLAATVIERDGALRIGKTSRKRSAAKVDACAAMLMTHSRSVYLATKPKKRKRAGTLAWY